MGTPHPNKADSGQSYRDGNRRCKEMEMANKGSQGKQGDQQQGSNIKQGTQQEQQGDQRKEGVVTGSRRGQSTAGNQDGTPGKQNSGRPGKGGS